MSKKLEAVINCPSCHHKFPMELYRTLWVEFPENLELVLSDGVNVMTCPKCGHTQRLSFSLLCTNVKKKFALWYEPEPDEQIDKDVVGYKKVMGGDSFYATAERVQDWQEFKKKLKFLDATNKEGEPLTQKPLHTNSRRSNAENLRQIHIDGTALSLAAGSGKAFFDILRELSGSDDAPSQVKQDFKNLCEWLGYNTDSNKQAAIKKMGEAWVSYLALGLPPSPKLADAFKTAKADSIKEKWPIIDVPDHVRTIFDRMLATDTEIAKMRNARQPDWAFDFSKAIPEVAGVAVLVIALMINSRDTDQGYYDFLRLSVTAVAGYLALRAYRLNQTVWLWLLGGIALLYNPVFRVHLDRDDWWPLNAGAAIVFAIYAYMTQQEQTKN